MEITTVLRKIVVVFVSFIYKIVTASSYKTVLHNCRRNDIVEFIF